MREEKFWQLLHDHFWPSKNKRIPERKVTFEAMIPDRYKR